MKEAEGGEGSGSGECRERDGVVARRVRGGRRWPQIRVVLSYLHDQSNQTIAKLVTSLVASHRDHGLYLSSQPPCDGCRLYALTGFKGGELTGEKAERGDPRRGREAGACLVTGFQYYYY